VLGGTGSIGAAVVDALLAREHDVIALTRSDSAAAHVEACGARALPGDIRAPDTWIATVDCVDAVIHAAGNFTPDAPLVERALMDALLTHLGQSGRSQTLIYTGGCWLYGPTGDAIATEDSPFNAPPAWTWMTDHVQVVRTASRFRGIVIHPAMVYERDGGVLASFRDDLATLGNVRIVGGEDVRWPLVHRADIGLLYALALERGASGRAYNGAAVDSIPVGILAEIMARRAGVRAPPSILSTDEVAAELGEWARGYALDQRMSGERARRELDWRPSHPDPISDIS
jgi:nucleoside-diphosphate-sugar epimerase